MYGEPKVFNQSLILAPVQTTLNHHLSSITTNHLSAKTIAMSKSFGLTTKLLHADDGSHSEAGIAPSISVSTSMSQPASVSRFAYSITAFREPIPEKLEYPSDPDPSTPDRHIYSRYTTPVSTRVEKVLSALLDAHAITYASGIAATTTVQALVHLGPKRLAIRDGYHGVHVSIEVYKKSRPDLELIDIDDEFRPGDVCWIETPLNPTGEARNLKHYADKIHAVGGRLIVDSTFAPPPLQDAFASGADIVLHSATKYLGGHSDLLCGVLAVKDLQEWHALWHLRTFTGNMMAASGEALAQWLHKISQTPAGQTYDGVRGGCIRRVWHATLQEQDQEWVKKQMPGGGPACFTIEPATSLGGVESLIEQRYLSDPKEDKRRLRLSVGLENLEVSSRRSYSRV
ncbi:cystathionine gamma-synthase [Rhizoctonia solani AG-1 IA]|uniref:Cystathionine gamma-synthase n=1 Tax=Thanatephorus cucumeris (strain AG1-IA) TaxID=983506 RepID=L8WHZ1_THACA|nr:cystathionine gamma-synthase [Rhizoctonia solani AG-1 IA]